MSYANLVNISCVDKTELFCRMRDFICKRNGTYDYSATGIGWTLWDSSYAADEDNPAINDWYVIKSSGENTDEDLYFRVFWASGYIRVHGFQAWNPTANTGGNQYSTITNAWTVADASAHFLWVYGDLDSIICLTNLSGATDVRSIDFGKADKPWAYLDDEVANCSSALTVGSDVSITVDAVPAGWAVDREVYIRTTHTDATAAVKIEKITIKTLVGSVITADLSNSYTADSKLSDYVGYHCRSSTTLATSNVLISASGSVSSGITAVSYDGGVAGTNNDPGGYESRWGMAEVNLNGNHGFFGKMRNICRVVTGALSLYDILEEADGTQWRYFKVYNNTHYVLKEV